MITSDLPSMFDFLCEVKYRVAYLSYPPLPKATHLTLQENALYSTLFSVRLSHSKFCIFLGANSESIRKTSSMTLPFSVILLFSSSVAMSCPGGSIYKSCGSRCSSTCLNISAADSCSSLPVEGCFCKEGYVLSGDTCVPESSCGCLDEKKQYHQASYQRHLKKTTKKTKGGSHSLSP